MKVFPPSSERRRAQSPPMTTVLESMARTVTSGAVIPVGSPSQVAPPSSVRSSVPKSPAAYPREPAKSIPFKVLPCGCGSPQNHPEWPTETPAPASTPRAPGLLAAPAPVVPMRTLAIAAVTSTTAATNGVRAR